LLLEGGYAAEFAPVFDPDLVDVLLDAGASPSDAAANKQPPGQFLEPPGLRRLLLRGLSRLEISRYWPGSELLLAANTREDLLNLARVASSESLALAGRRHTALCLAAEDVAFTIAYGMLLVEWRRSGSSFAPARWVEFDRQLLSVDRSLVDENEILVGARHVGVLRVDRSDLSLIETIYSHPNQWIGDSISTPIKALVTPEGSYFGVRSASTSARDAAWTERAGLLVLRETGRDIGDSTELELLSGANSARLARIWVDEDPRGDLGGKYHETLDSGRVVVSNDQKWAIVVLRRSDDDLGAWSSLVFISLTNESEGTACRTVDVAEIAPYGSGAVAGVAGKNLTICDPEGFLRTYEAQEQYFDIDSCGTVVVVLTEAGVVQLDQRTMRR
jgi:hypothetical protein